MKRSRCHPAIMWGINKQCEKVLGTLKIKTELANTQTETSNKCNNHSNLSRGKIKYLHYLFTTQETWHSGMQID